MIQIFLKHFSCCRYLCPSEPLQVKVYFSDIFFDVDKINLRIVNIPTITIVCLLHRMSQWIAACSDQALLSALSTALDRLLSAKRDPVVKYDQRTAIWTYLHRNR